jgi:hypothetical protein
MKIFLVFKIFWFHNFDLFQVKVQLIFKFEVDYIMFFILDYSLFVGTSISRGNVADA